VWLHHSGLCQWVSEEFLLLLDQTTPVWPPKFLRSKANNGKDASKMRRINKITSKKTNKTKQYQTKIRIKQHQTTSNKINKIIQNQTKTNRIKLKSNKIKSDQTKSHSKETSWD
jgi:hypothetical protein